MGAFAYEDEEDPDEAPDDHGRNRPSGRTSEGRGGAGKRPSGRNSRGAARPSIGEGGEGGGGKFQPGDEVLITGLTGEDARFNGRA